MSTITVGNRSITTADVVAGNVRAEAARQGLNQVQLGKLLGYTQATIAKRWRGVYPWQLRELDSVAEALGVTVNDLVTPSEHKKNPALGRVSHLLPRLDSNQQPFVCQPRVMGVTHMKVAA